MQISSPNVASVDSLGFVGFEDLSVKIRLLPCASPDPCCFPCGSSFLSVSLPLFSLQQGEVDCWPLPCPDVECEFSVLPENECCPRCVTDPCQADTIRNDITKTCLDEMNVVRFTGSSWIKHGTECTLCQCKVRSPGARREHLPAAPPGSEMLRSFTWAARLISHLCVAQVEVGAVSPCLVSATDCLVHL